MIHLTGAMKYANRDDLYRTHLLPCGAKKTEADDVVKFDDLHRQDKELDCVACIKIALARLRQKRIDLATNAVHIHNKQVVNTELIDKFSAKVE